MVSQNFFYDKVHPHHAMHGPPEFLFNKVHPHHMMPGLREFFFPKGPHSSGAADTWWSTRIFFFDKVKTVEISTKF
jgi:hypothetical protein